jgi:hypothetical protein
VSEAGAAKAELALTLQEAGLDVYDYIPERVTPPVVVIRSGSPYIAPSSVGSTYDLNLELVIVAGFATNETTIDDLDDLIEQTLLAIPSDAGVGSVASPYLLVMNGNDHLATTINVDLQISI